MPIKNLFRAMASGAPPIRQTVRETAQQVYGKGSKLQTAIDAVEVQDYQAIADADRRSTNEYRDKKLNLVNSPKGGDPVGDITVADNITNIQRSPMSSLIWASAGVLITVGIAGMIMATGLLDSEKTEQAPNVQPIKLKAKWKIGLDGKMQQELWQIMPNGEEVKIEPQ